MTSITGESLSPQHLRELHAASAISREQIAARGYTSEFNPRNLPAPFTGDQRRAGLLIPIRNTRGELVTWQLKPDEPRHDRNSKPIKYETPKGGRVCVDVPAAALPFLEVAEADLWITEGAKKVDSAVSHGIPCTIGVLGVDMWRHDRGRALADWREIALDGRPVVIAYDSDVMAKPGPRRAIEELADYLTSRGAHVRYCLIPPRSDGTKRGLDDAFADGFTRVDLEACIVDTLPDSGPAWESPIPLDEPAGPPLPIHALPAIMRDIVRATADQLQAPPDLVYGVVMGTISLAAAGKYRVYYEPTEWREPLHTMTTPVAGPGSNKSAIFERITRPVNTWEREEIAKTTGLLEEWESKERALENRLTAAEKAEGKPDKDGKITDGEALRKAALDELQRHRETRPIVPDLYGDDATPESVKERMAGQGGAYGVLSAESAFLSLTAGGRYNRGYPNLDVILNGHPGDAVKITRVGKPTVVIEHAWLTLCLMLQPEVMAALGQTPGIITRGVAARLLPCFPVDTVGHRNTGPRPKVPADAESAWHSAIVRLLETSRPSPPRDLSLSHEAEATFTAFRTSLEPRIPAEGPEMRGWLAKLAGSVLRIAGQFHVMQHEDPVNVAITATTLGNAIVVGNYFHEHARIMFRIMAGRSGMSEAHQVWGTLQSLPNPTTKRDIHRKLQDRIAFQKAEALTEPLAILEEYGWVNLERQGKSIIVTRNPLTENPDDTDNAHRTPAKDAPLTALSVFPLDRESEVENLPATGTHGVWRLEL